MIVLDLKPVYKMQGFLKVAADTIGSVLKMILLTRFPVPHALSLTAREMVLLGNGPSLKLFLQEKQDFMKGKELMMVNYAALSESFEQHKPKYYLLLDPAFFKKEEKLRGVLFLHLIKKRLKLQIRMSYNKNSRMQ